MMEKLELKHVVGYYPYTLKIENSYGDIVQVDSIEDNGFKYFRSTKRELSHIYESKPILRPLSDLTREIEVNCEKVVPKKLLKSWNEGIYHTSDGIKIFFDEVCYKDIQKLYEWNFDIHGLIEKGLAIDINTLK